MQQLSSFDTERLRTLVETARHGLGHLFADASSGKMLSAINETESVQKALALIHDIIEPPQPCCATCHSVLERKRNDNCKYSFLCPRCGEVNSLIIK